MPLTDLRSSHDHISLGVEVFPLCTGWGCETWRECGGITQSEGFEPLHADCKADIESASKCPRVSEVSFVAGVLASTFDFLSSFMESILHQSIQTLATDLKTDGRSANP